jgi:hypothetical protein
MDQTGLDELQEAIEELDGCGDVLFRLSLSNYEPQSFRNARLFQGHLTELEWDATCVDCTDVATMCRDSTQLRELTV